MRLAAEAKLGYYPCPAETLELLCRHLKAAEPSAILDPCAGQGAALKQIATALGGVPWAIELDEGRTEALKAEIEHSLAPCSFLGARISTRSFGLVWCNPPFTDDECGFGRRLEYTFLTRATPLLVPGGIMVLMMPERQLDWSIREYLRQHYDELCQLAPPANLRQYDECLLIGKRRPEPVEESYDDLPEGELGRMQVQWTVPRASGPKVFAKCEPTPAELERLLAASPLERLFKEPPPPRASRCPLPLAKGHLALLLAAGRLDGFVPGDPCHVVRGRCRKEGYVAEQREEEKESGTTSVTIMKEKLVLSVRVVGQDGDILTLE